MIGNFPKYTFSITTVVFWTFLETMDRSVNSLICAVSLGVITFRLFACFRNGFLTGCLAPPSIDLDS